MYNHLCINMYIAWITFMVIALNQLRSDDTAFPQHYIFYMCFRHRITQLCSQVAAEVAATSLGISLSSVHLSRGFPQRSLLHLQLTKLSQECASTLIDFDDGMRKAPNHSMHKVPNRGMSPRKTLKQRLMQKIAGLRLDWNGK